MAPAVGTSYLTHEESELLSKIENYLIIFFFETGSFFVNATMFRTLAFTLRAPDPGSGAALDFISVRVMK